MKGTVSLLVVGPPNPDLLPGKAIRRIERADLIVLLDEGLRPVAEAHASENTRIRPSQAEPGTGDLDALLPLLREHRYCVLLRSDLPFGFSNGAREARWLRDRELPFEILSGGSPFTSIPPFAEIPLAPPSSPGRVLLVRDPDGTTEEAYPPLQTLDTVMIWSRDPALPRVANSLIERGLDPHSPVAVIRNGTLPTQHTREVTLDELRAGGPDGSEPAGEDVLVVVGESVGWRSGSGWFESRPLAGRRIVVTRPRDADRRFSEQLQEEGALTLHHPTITITPSQQGLEVLSKTLPSLSSYDWLVFTSRNGVKYFFRTLHRAGRDARALGSLQVACIGEGTASRLGREGLEADLVPETFRAEDLAEALLQRCGTATSFLLPRAAGARPVLPDRLRDRGHRVREIHLYRAEPAREARADLRGALVDRPADMITFTSSSTVDCLFELFQNNSELSEQLNAMDCAAIGPITASTLEKRGVRVDVVPDQYDFRSYCRAIVAYYGEESESSREVQTG